MSIQKCAGKEQSLNEHIAAVCDIDWIQHRLHTYKRYGTAILGAWKTYLPPMVCLMNVGPRQLTLNDGLPPTLKNLTATECVPLVRTMLPWRSLFRWQPPWLMTT